MIQNIAAVSFAKRRKKGNERQLTDEVGVLCARDALLAREVARAVLRVAAGGDHGPSSTWLTASRRR